MSPIAMAALDPLATAAEYYYVRHDYKQALELWTTVAKRQPDSLAAVTRVAELRLMYQGRTQARETLVSFLDAGPRPADTRRAAEEKLGQLQSTFLTDDGQSAFYRALPIIARGECEAAIPLLQQAAQLEKGNLPVLREKSRCELSLGQPEKSYQTLQQSFDLDPFSPDTLDNLVEAHLYFRAPEKVAEVFRRAGSPRTARQRVAYGVALAETGASAEAVALLQPLLVQDKQRSVHPLVSWALGTALAPHASSRSESLGFLDAFLAAATVPESLKVDGWDPYRSAERIESAKKLVATLRPPD